jgi:hypothetical protein
MFSKCLHFRFGYRLQRRRLIARETTNDMEVATRMNECARILKGGEIGGHTMHPIRRYF